MVQLNKCGYHPSLHVCVVQQQLFGFPDTSPAVYPPLPITHPYACAACAPSCRPPRCVRRALMSVTSAAAPPAPHALPALRAVSAASTPSAPTAPGRRWWRSHPLQPLLLLRPLLPLQVPWAAPRATVAVRRGRRLAAEGQLWAAAGVMVVPGGQPPGPAVLTGEQQAYWRMPPPLSCVQLVLVRPVHAAPVPSTAIAPCATSPRRCMSEGC
jgi:hypothetical protein